MAQLNNKPPYKIIKDMQDGKYYKVYANGEKIPVYNPGQKKYKPLWEINPEFENKANKVIEEQEQKVKPNIWVEPEPNINAYIENDPGIAVINPEPVGFMNIKDFHNYLKKQVNGIGKAVEENDMAGKILKTVGVELESLGLTQKRVGYILSELPGLLDKFKVHRDGSSEIKAFVVAVKSRQPMQYAKFNYHTKEAMRLFLNKYNTYTSGYELISTPMEIETFEDTIKLLLPKLETSGDFISERCATHIHVGVRKDIKTAKNLLKLGLWADELFYALSGMGTKFRGYSNNAIYARPLINGPFFKYNGAWYKTLNYEKALEAEDLYNFFATYGLDIQGDPGKYHPARYFGINIYSMLLHNTIEFRHFNQTFDAGFVVSVAKLCQLFTEICLKSKLSDLDEFKPGDPFITMSPSHYLYKLHKLLNFARDLDCTYILNDRDVSHLERLIRTYDGIGVNDLQVSTHIKEVNTSSEIIALGELEKSKGKVHPDGHTDIHNIEYSSILGDK